MLVAQKEWILDPFPDRDSDWVIHLVQFGEGLGEKCFALLEGNEENYQRTYLGFGQGWILTPETFNPSSPLDPSNSPNSPNLSNPLNPEAPDPLEHLRRFREVNSPNHNLESGIMGYLDYEWGLRWQKPQASSAHPRYFFRLCPINLVLLPYVKKIVLEVFSESEEHLQQNLTRWVNALNHFFSYNSSPNPVPHPAPDILPSWQPNMTRENFLSRIEKIKEYIRAGDIFQAVLSQRFTLKSHIEPWITYKKLRQLNPSPWLYCVWGVEETLVGSSPELLISSIDSRIQTRPIAGTRPRGKTIEEDQNLEKELLEDSKEMAEHAMLVDLGRNDLGRVSKYGSVKVSEYAGIQRFSHVMHIVSTVEGELDPSHDSLDALRAVFPAGTLSGAPKVRAMEILQDIEPNFRHAYGGALGIVRWNGDLDFCITIRTLYISEEEVSIQTGAGIVFDSVPEREYEETLHKANALFKVIDFSE